jgi:hypothetical protein
MNSYIFLKLSATAKGIFEKNSENVELERHL